MQGDEASGSCGAGADSCTWQAKLQRDPPASGGLACKTGDTDDEDCLALNLPQKLDCNDSASAQAAGGRGCKREDPTDANDFDMCCPRGVTGSGGGGSDASGGSGKNVGCVQKAGADSDSDCVSNTARPRKLDCQSESETAEALQAGCTRTSPTDGDVCCPKTISGSAPSF